MNESETGMKSLPVFPGDSEARILLLHFFWSSISRQAFLIAAQILTRQLAQFSRTQHPAYKSIKPSPNNPSTAETKLDQLDVLLNCPRVSFQILTKRLLHISFSERSEVFLHPSHCPSQTHSLFQGIFFPWPYRLTSLTWGACRRKFVTSKTQGSAIQPVYLVWKKTKQNQTHTQNPRPKLNNFYIVKNPLETWAFVLPQRAHSSPVILYRQTSSLLCSNQSPCELKWNNKRSVCSAISMETQKQTWCYLL